MLQKAVLNAKNSIRGIPKPPESGPGKMMTRGISQNDRCFFGFLRLLQWRAGGMWGFSTSLSDDREEKAVNG